MRNLKKFLALVLAFMMAMSLMVTVNAANVTFDDGEEITAEFQDDITILAGIGVIKGQGNGEDGLLTPQRTITRAEMAAIVYRLHTGDVNDTRTDLYKGSADFNDVPETEWFAGYIGYCNSAQIIVGDGNGYFRPNEPVTGYEALTMLLRAMGYDQNREFSSSAISWQVQVAQIATTRGLLVNTDKTTYSSKLSEQATRELVFELAFQAATRPTVQYTAAFGYQIYALNGIMLSGILNPTLAQTFFGLTSIEGHVVGNQATGEKGTRLDIGYSWAETKTVLKDEFGYEIKLNGDGDLVYRFKDDGTKNDDWDDAENTVIEIATGETYRVENDNYEYNSSNSLFDVETGLNMFGHAVTVWYDRRTGNSDKGFTTFAIFDDAVLAEYVYAEDAILSYDGVATNSKLGAAANKAGFSVALDAGTALFSDRYSRIDTVSGPLQNKTGTASPVNMYYLVSNNSAKSVDVVVILSAEVAEITEVNTTAKDKYLTLGTNTANTSSFHNGTSGQIKLSNLAPDSVQEIGELVTAWEIKGTKKASPTAGDYIYQLDAVKTRTGMVSSFAAPTGGYAVQLDSTSMDAVTQVNFTDGTYMELSGITKGTSSTSKIISQVLPIVVNDTDTNVANSSVNVTNLKAGMTYTVYEDVIGRFISMTTGSDTTFLYGTFADFEIGALGTGTHRYTITGVDQNGKKQENLSLIATDVSGTMTKIEGNVSSTYNALSITKKDYASVSNQINEGANTGYMITSDGELYNYTGKKMADNTAGNTAGNTWTIDGSDVSVGVARVKNNEDVTGDGVIDASDTTLVEYLLTNNTKFYVVEGSGTATLNVTPYNGIKELLGSSSSVDIEFDANMDEVIFWTEKELYGTTNADSNHNVAAVILSDTNLNRWDSKNMYFSYEADSTGSGLVLPGAGNDVKLFKLYNNGKAGYYFIDTNISGGASSMAAKTFYVLTPCDEINGVTIYKAVAQLNNSTLSYGDDHNASNVFYNYIAVNNLNHAVLQKTGDVVNPDGLVFSVGDAVICDAEYENETTTTIAGRTQITSIAQLNNAISVMNTAQSAPVYDVEVAVVYSGANVETIYIVEVTTH